MQSSSRSTSMKTLLSFYRTLKSTSGFTEVSYITGGVNHARENALLSRLKWMVNLRTALSSGAISRACMLRWKLILKMCPHPSKSPYAMSGSLVPNTREVKHCLPK